MCTLLDCSGSGISYDQAGLGQSDKVGFRAYRTLARLAHRFTLLPLVPPMQRTAKSNVQCIP